MSSAAAATKSPHHIVNSATDIPSVPETTTSTLSVASAKGTKSQVLKYMVAEALNSISKYWFDFGHIIIPLDQTGQLETIDENVNKPVPKTLEMFKLLQESVSEINFEKFFNNVEKFAQIHGHNLLPNPNQNLAEIKNNEQWPFVDNEPGLNAAFLDNEVIPQLAEKWQIIGYLLLPENWGQVDSIRNDKKSNEDRLSAVFETAKELNKPITYSTLKNLFYCTSIGKGALFDKIPFPADCMPTPLKQKDVQKVTPKQPNASTESEASTTQCSSSTAHTSPSPAQSEVPLQQNMQELQIQLDEMKRQLHESQEKNKSSESKSAALQEQLEKMGRQLHELQEKNKSSDSKNVELQSQLESIKNQQQETSDGMKALRETNVTLQTENRTLKNRYDNAVKNKAESMGDTLKNALETCKKREDEKKELQKRIDALNAELQTASQSKAVPRVSNNALVFIRSQADEIIKLKEDQKNHKSEILALKLVQVDNQEKIASLNQGNEKFKVDSLAQQIKAKKLQRELDAKTKENQELTENIRTLVTDVYKSKNNNAELKNEIEKLNNEIAKLTHEVKILKHRNNQAAKHRGLDPQHDAIKSPALVTTPDVMSCLFEKHKKFSTKMAGHLVSLKGELGNFSKTKLEKESESAKLQKEVLRQLDMIQELTLEYDSEVIIQQSLFTEAEKRASERAQENLELSDKLKEVYTQLFNEKSLVKGLAVVNKDLETELKQVKEKLSEKEAILIQLQTL